MFVELGKLHGTSSIIESTWVTCSASVSHNRVQVLSIPVLLLAGSQDWTCNLIKEAMPITVTPCVLLDSLEWIFGLINLMFLLDLDYYYCVWHEYISTKDILALTQFSFLHILPASPYWCTCCPKLTHQETCMHSGTIQLQATVWLCICGCNISIRNYCLSAFVPEEAVWIKY